MNKDNLVTVWVWFNFFTLVMFVVAWPITAKTVFKHEPQGVLGLSYLALIIGAMGNLIATLILRHVDDDIGDKDNPTEWEGRKGSIGRAR